MDREIYISSGVARGRVQDLLARLRTVGWPWLELASGLPCSEAELRDLELARAAGFSFLVHNYFPAPDEPFVLNLAAEDSGLRRRSEAHCRRAVDICRRLGTPFFSVHAGFARPLRSEDLGRPERAAARGDASPIDVVGALARFKVSIRSLADYAEASGVRILVENNVVAPAWAAVEQHGLLMANAEEICEFFLDLAHPNVGLLLDVAHAKVSSVSLGFSLERFMRAVLPWVEAFHLSDNDGTADTNEPFPADAWFMPAVRLKEKATCVVEVYGLETDSLQKQLTALRNGLCGAECSAV